MENTAHNVRSTSQLLLSNCDGNDNDVTEVKITVKIYLVLRQIIDRNLLKHFSIP